MIYLLKSNDKLKVGYTNNFAERFKNYQSHNPDIELVNMKSGTREDERVIHDYLKDRIVVGEWYSYGDSIVHTFEDYVPIEERVREENKRLAEKILELTHPQEVSSLVASAVRVDKEEDLLEIPIMDLLHGDEMRVLCGEKIIYHRIGNKYIKTKK